MERKFTLISLLLTFVISYGQSSENYLKNAFGLVIGPGFQSNNERNLTIGIRGKHTFNKVFTVGVELDYQQFTGIYRNSDAIGGIFFGRLTPLSKGLFTEFGFQGNKSFSTSRSSNQLKFSPYINVGYEVKINKRLGMEIQYRPYTFGNSTYENQLFNIENLPSKFFFGLNYSF